METPKTPKTDASSSSYWRSLDEKYQTPEFVENLNKEFMSSPMKTEEGKSGLARRQFMKLMGASVAMSAAACVRRPVQKIIPYNQRPKDIIPGLPNYYASSWMDGLEGIGTLVKTREGRPLHVAGNKENPTSGGGLSPRASAHILSLYDPDRLTSPMVNAVNPKKRKNGIAVKRKWDDVDAQVSGQLKKGAVRIVTSSYPSKHTEALMESFASKFDGQVVYWDVLSTETSREAQKIAYGSEVVPQWHLDKSKVTVSIDGDILGTLRAPTKQQKDFSLGRNPDGPMSRLISFHSMPSLTSLNADDNYPIRSSHQFALAVSLLNGVLKKSGKTIPQKLKPYVMTDAELGIKQGALKEVVSLLSKHPGESLVVTGGLQTETNNALNLQLVVNWLNSALQNEGKTVTTTQSYQGHKGSYSAMKELIGEMAAGSVKTVIFHNVNPQYSLPSDMGFEEALNSVEMVVSANNWMDETTTMANIIAPSGHSMETWNEFEFVNGVSTMQQPTISPLHDTRSFEDSLMKWAADGGQAISSESNFYDYLMASLKMSKQALIAYMKQGFQAQANASSRARTLNESRLLSAISPQEHSTETELVLYSTSHLRDGSLNNVSWLLELPDPVTKVTWDNYLAMSPQKAKEMALGMGSLVKVATDNFEAKLPVYIQPGLQKDVVAVAVGYGRQAGGHLAKGMGVNAYPFAKEQGGRMVFSGMPVKITPQKGHYDLAVTQGHHSMEGRQIVAETSFNEYKSGQDAVHRHKMFSIWPEHKYEGHKWAMSVDLNSCTGCSACMVSCQSENNIPTVGKKYILQGREMHWIRIDRYYKGDESSPDAVFQPVMCQHCENAPCETVCPVLATVHSDEGLNDMVYNRCVGTRYCSNNCPYKVRRFNWFYYSSHVKEPLNLALNPDVSVRTRGVMEKCTFCVQRIKDAKNTAADEDRALKDGDITTACQDACPTDAIVFGDMNDKESRVAKMFANQREYTLLEEYNAVPRVRYMSKVRHTDRTIAKDHGHGGGHGDDHGDGHGQDDHHNEENHGNTHKDTHS